MLACVQRIELLTPQAFRLLYSWAWRGECFPVLQLQAMRTLLHERPDSRINTRVCASVFACAPERTPEYGDLLDSEVISPDVTYAPCLLHPGSYVLCARLSSVCQPPVLSANLSYLRRAYTLFSQPACLYRGISYFLARIPMQDFCSYILPINFI